MSAKSLLSLNLHRLQRFLYQHFTGKAHYSTCPKNETQTANWGKLVILSTENRGELGKEDDQLQVGSNDFN